MFIYHWQDPFIFRHEGRTFMALGGRLEKEDGDCVVLLYEAADPMYSQWKYRCIMFAAVEGFVNTRGWNGVQCVPRVLSLEGDGTLIQKVPEEYRLLRSERRNLLEHGTVIMTEAVFEVKASLNPDEKF